MSSKGNHVAFITLHRAGNGGSEILWSQSAKQLHDSGYRVSVYHHVRSPVIEAKLPWAAFANSYACLEDRSSFLQRAAKAIDSRLLGNKKKSKLYKYLAKTRPDFVIINCGHLCGSPSAAACRELGISYGMLVQLANDTQWPSDSWRQGCREMYLSAKLNVFVSKRNQEMVETMIGARLNNAALIRNPCLILTKAPISWPLGETLQFALPARLEIHDKGHDILLNLLATPNWMDRSWILNLYGKGHHQQGIIDQIKMLGIETRVRIHGHVTDVKSIWLENHLAVLPSRAEGLPLALIEAMSAGRPSVVTDVGGNAELVEEGVSGFIAEAPALSCLSAAMERAWARRHEWGQIGVNAHNRVAELWKIDPAEILTRHVIDCCNAQKFV